MANKKKQSFEVHGDTPKTLKDHPFYGLQLDEQQIEFRDAIWNPDNLIVFANSKAGTGKAQPVDTIIPTPNGNMRLGDLKVGDYVFDRAGRPTKVLGIFPQGKQKAFKVTLSDGRSTICCDEHLWTYYRNNDGVAITETLASMLKRSILCGNSHASARYNIPTNEAVEYIEKKLPVDPYILGLFLGDGCCTQNRLEFSSNDEELPRLIAAYLDCDYKRNSEKNYTWHFIKNKKSVLTNDVLKDVPEVMNYSYNKKIPKMYLMGSIEQRYSLLQGLLDTDGGVAIAETRYNIRYTTVSKELANNVVELCRSLGMIATIQEDRREKYTSGIAYNVSILCSNYMKDKCFRLDRKVNIAKQAKNTDKRRKYNQIAIRNIEDMHYECEMACIYVDNPEHLYLTNDYIVTHNTLIAVATANLLVQYGLYDGIVYVVSPVQEEKSGFLPGDADSKTKVYTAPLYDALVKLNINPFTAVNQESIMNQKDGAGYIDCVSHLWLRGCNLERKIVVVEESQNFYTDELKKVLTRISDTSKTIVIGHSGQCDLYHYSERSGFEPYIEHFKNEPYAQICNLTINHRGKVSTHADEL